MTNTYIRIEEERKLEDARKLEEDWKICPMCLDQFTEPVVAGDGYTYDFSCLNRWFARVSSITTLVRSPKTNVEMTMNVTPNFTLAMALDLPVGKLVKLVPQPVKTIQNGDPLFDLFKGLHELAYVESTQAFASALVWFLNSISYSEWLHTEISADQLGRIESAVEGAVRQFNEIRYYTLDDFDERGSYAYEGYIDRVLGRLYRTFPPYALYYNGPMTNRRRSALDPHIATLKSKLAPYEIKGKNDGLRTFRGVWVRAFFVSGPDGDRRLAKLAERIQLRLGTLDDTTRAKALLILSRIGPTRVLE